MIDMKIMFMAMRVAECWAHSLSMVGTSIMNVEVQQWAGWRAIADETSPLCGISSIPRLRPKDEA